MNLTILHGYIGRMGDLKHVGENQTGILEFSVATSETYKGTKKTTWHNCKAFGKRADTMAQYFAKGSEILLWGRIELEKWENKEGEKRSRVSIVVNSFDFCGKKGERQEASAGETPPANQAEAGVADSGPAEETPSVEPADDDDLPF